MKAAIDIGGTFTDVILYDERTGHLWTAKVHSTPHDPARAFLSGLQAALKNARADIRKVESITHGTTIVTNALLEGQTAPVGLLVTGGFCDLLEIGRQVRPRLYDLFADRLPPLVTRQHVLEVIERLDAKGQVLIPLDEKQAQEQLIALADFGVEALAIVLLFSFLNSEHEKTLSELARNHFPGKFIFRSSQISPEFREYERASTTVVAAAVAPRVVTYLSAIEKGLAAQNWDKAGFSLMHSGGGLLPSEQSGERPHTLIESGPAAGVIASARLARELNLARVLAFDMGGTTAKASLVLDGKPQYTTEYEVGGSTHRAGRALGSGYPVRFPMIDVAECGAGAGSIAWIDPGGYLKVGPQSAGADPGPACYSRGGKQPTITDAYLTLGLLSPEGFLGGDMKLDPGSASRAIDQHVARPLAMELHKAASGILEIANANMLGILRLVSIQRGYDPRDFSLIAYGGAGPLHAVTLAEQMSIHRVIIPHYPALFSALGLLHANPNSDFTQTVMLSLEPENIPRLRAVLSSLNAQAEAWFERSLVPQKERLLQANADLRYLRQNHELTVDLPLGEFTTKKLEKLSQNFHLAHQRAYGHGAPGETIQVVNIRLKAVHKIEKPAFQPMRALKIPAEIPPAAGRQEVWSHAERRSFSVYKREDLHIGLHLQGPLIVQEREATTLVEENWELTVDMLGNLILQFSES